MNENIPQKPQYTNVLLLIVKYILPSHLKLIPCHIESHSFLFLSFIQKVPERTGTCQVMVVHFNVGECVLYSICQQWVGPDYLIESQLGDGSA
ncbi:hypothetical protein UPYG_G00013240 [Umbra pygmaea]|uniref:Uncharacterized protein n=1 Tax=Umbra pygmaea TaxID=75934 RepID=A0ABD0Y6E3_UMBPY